MKSSQLGSILAIVKVSKKKKKKQPLLSHRVRKVFLFFRASLSYTLSILSVLSATKNNASIHCEHHHPKKKEKKEKRNSFKKI